MTTLTVFPHRRRAATASPCELLVPLAGEHATPVRGECSRPDPLITLHAPCPGPGPSLITPSCSRRPAVTWPARRICAAAISPIAGAQMRRIDCVVPAMKGNALTTTTSRATNGAAVILHTVARSVAPTAPVRAMTHPRLAGATGAGHRTTDTVPGPRHLHIIGTVPARSSATMNTPHALDESLVDFAVFRRKMLRLFLRDQTLDPDERALLDEFDGEHDDLAAYRARQLAAHQFERNGDTRRTRDAFRAAGHNLVDLAAERQTRRSNVIPLYPNRKDAS